MPALLTLKTRLRAWLLLCATALLSYGFRRLLFL